MFRLTVLFATFFAASVASAEGPMISAKDGNKYQLVDAENFGVRLSGKQTKALLAKIQSGANALANHAAAKAAPLRPSERQLPSTLVAELRTVIQKAGSQNVVWDLQSFPKPDATFRMLRATVPKLGVVEVRFDSVSDASNAAPRFSLQIADKTRGAFSWNRQRGGISVESATGSQSHYEPLKMAKPGQRGYLVRLFKPGVRKVSKMELRSSKGAMLSAKAVAPGQLSKLGLTVRDGKLVSATRPATLLRQTPTPKKSNSRKARKPTRSRARAKRSRARR